MRFPGTGRLRARLLLLVALAVVPALAMILYDGFDERRAAGVLARSEALALARDAVRDQRQLVLETRQLLTLLAGFPQLTGDPEECNRFLRDVLARGSPYANLGVVRPDGIVACGALPFEPGLSVADRSWFRRARETRDFSVGDYQIGRITGLASLNFAYPVRGAGGELAGVVYAALPLTWLQERIVAADLPPGSAVTVADSALTVLARYPDGEEWVGRSVRGTEFAAAIRLARGDTTLEATGLDGVERLYAIVPLREEAEGAVAHLTVGIPTSVAYAPAARALGRNLTLLALITLLVTAAAWRGSDLLVLRPLGALLAATRRLGAGELDARAHVSSRGGEIAELARSFNEMADRLAYVANYDPLTGLPNRTLFDDRLGQALARARQDGRHLAVVSLAVDRLAEVEAEAGRTAAEELLRAVAAHLSGALREGDTVARLDGHEFGVVLADLDELVEAETRASGLVSGAPRTLVVGEHELSFSLQAGAAVHPHDGDEAAALLRSAVLARRAADAASAGAVAFFSAEIDARAQRRRVIERELRHAIERDELTLFYQPVVEVRCREVVGVEALVRWRSEKLGAMSPMHFIPVAEESGLIGAMGEWILRTAARQGKRWHALGFTDIRVNVNVSVEQLRQPGFVDRISAILEEAACDPRALALGIEITESELMENLQDAVAAILRFREMGMKVYIDDFGTGYSSLSYLRELPIDTLKIDASFIRDIPGDADAVAVVKGILAMAEGLELRVIAEGVETEEQLAILREHGCDAVQGYLFGKPAPPEEVERLFGRRL